VEDGHADRHEQFGARCGVALQELFGRVERAPLDAKRVEVDEEAVVRQLVGEVREEGVALAEDGVRDAGVGEAFDSVGERFVVCGPLVHEVRGCAVWCVLLYLLADDQWRAGCTVAEFPAAGEAVDDHDGWLEALDFAQVGWEIRAKHAVFDARPRSFAVEKRGVDWLHRAVLSVIVPKEDWCASAIDATLRSGVAGQPLVRMRDSRTSCSRTAREGGGVLDRWGIASYNRPRSRRPVVALRTPPHCLKKKSVACASHCALIA